jgi:hypothetical protein
MSTSLSHHVRPHSEFFSPPYILTNPTAGGLQKNSVALAPLLLVFLSAGLHVLAPSKKTPRLQLGLVLFFVGVVNSVNYICMCYKKVSPDINSHSALVPFKSVFETWARVVTCAIAAGPSAILLFFISEILYYGLVWLCCGSENLGAFQSFHNRLHKHLRKMGHGVVETTTDGMANIHDWVLLCFSVSEEESDNQASLPPPYWVSPLLFHCAPFHGLTLF